MLNEIGEYRQYTLTPKEIVACEYPRLKYLTLIKREFSGLERALTIIARHFMFDFFDAAAGLSEKNLNEVREILKAWCGFKHAAQSNLPNHFENWLVNYIHCAFLSESLKSFRDKIPAVENEKLRTDLSNFIEKIISADRAFNVRDALTAFEVFKVNNAEELKKIGNEPAQILTLFKALVTLADRNKNFSKNLFGSLNAKGDIPFRAITYDKIIANALLAGKLRRYYLVCDSELFKTKKILKGSTKLLASDKDMILKMTAEYFLQRRYTNQNFIETNDSNMVNWIVGSRKAENFCREKYVLAETGENIFEIRKINLGGINAIKIKINPEWTQHFSLLEDTAENLGQIFFSDAGSSEPLRENVRY